MRNERYYYSVMVGEEKKAYKMIFDGIKARALNIVVSADLSIESIQGIYFRVLYDNPTFYFINQRVIRITGNPGYYILYPEYLYNNSEIKIINNDIKNIINKVKVKGRNYSDNGFRLEKYLHDTVVKSVAYDYESLKNDNCYKAHSIVGAFLDNKAVCEGIAKAFKLLCNEFNIKCMVVLGKANEKGDFSGNDYHAWNLVKIGNESYHVDVTWDNLYDKEIRHISYDYFNVTTEDILLDHLPEDKLPICNSLSLNYFYSTNSYVNSFTSLLKLISERYNSKEIMFRTSSEKGEFLSNEELKQKTLSAMMIVSLTKIKKKKYITLFNYTQKIGKIIFQE